MYSEKGVSTKSAHHPHTYEPRAGSQFLISEPHACTLKQTSNLLLFCYRKTRTQTHFIIRIFVSWKGCFIRFSHGQKIKKKYILTTCVCVHKENEFLERKKKDSSGNTNA